MQYSSLYYNPSPILVLKARIVEHWYNIAENIKQWLINDMIENFDKRTQYFSNEFSKVDELTIASASRKLADLKRTIKLLEKLGNSISHIPHNELKKSFNQFKKIVFKLEARLHRISVSENPIIETPESLKEQLSGSGIKSISKELNSADAIS